MTYFKRNAPTLLLWLLLTTLSGCSSLPSTTPPPAARVPPPPPELMEPEDRSATYLELVQRLLLDWQKKLTDWKIRS